MTHGPERLQIAVVGTGISGMAAAWLLSQQHDVTVYEQAARLGGHSNTIDVPGRRGPVPVDMGFIVYNETTYPNLTALFRHLGVPTRESDMSFAVSLDGGRLEYAGTDLSGLFAQKRNLLRPRFWAMLRDLARFYREAPGDVAATEASGESLGAYAARRGYGEAFMCDHLLPMAAAIWSAPNDAAAAHPAASFIRFCDNHGLLKLRDRPAWRTVDGGSRAYVSRLTASYAGAVRLSCGVRQIRRGPTQVRVDDTLGGTAYFDHVVIGAHANQALGMLADPSNAETAVLGAFRYGANDAVMHGDVSLMPKRRRVWASWNHMGGSGTAPPCISYWMNRLQSLPGAAPIFVTLNPDREPAPGTVFHRERYEHPVQDLGALQAQRALWSLQGPRTWFCGAYFGAGFHEDGLQAGLAVAEQLGGVRRPWRVAEESGRIHVQAPRLPLPTDRAA
jgi:uncharacterized protein